MYTKKVKLPALLQTSQPFSFKSRLNASVKYKRPIEIKDRHSGRVLFETEAETLKDALEEAVMFGVNLSCADLRNADLGGAYLASAQLSNADFSGANLFKAILMKSHLMGTRFCNVDLRYADIRYANLKKAALRNSNLTRAQFLQSNVTKSDFRSSNLEGADLQGANITSTSFDARPKAPEEGSFVGWKRVYDIRGNPVMAKLLIPEDAERTTPLFGRICRAKFVKVLELSPDVSFAKCRHYPDRIYHVGKVVETVDHGSNVMVGVTEFGIHFHLTREEAERDYGLESPLVPTAEYWKGETYRGWVGGVKCINQPDN